MHGANFMQNNHSWMQELDDHRELFAFEFVQIFALKHLEEILDCIDDISRYAENLIQNELGERNPDLSTRTDLIIVGIAQSQSFR